MFFFQLVDEDYNSEDDSSVVALQYGSSVNTRNPANKYAIYKCGCSMYLQSLSQTMNASMEELARCPGIGEQKVLQRAHIGYPFERNCKLPILSFFFFYRTLFPCLICVCIVLGKMPL